MEEIPKGAIKKHLHTILERLRENSHGVPFFKERLSKENELKIKNLAYATLGALKIHAPDDILLTLLGKLHTTFTESAASEWRRVFPGTKPWGYSNEYFNPHNYRAENSEYSFESESTSDNSEEIILSDLLVRFFSDVTAEAEAERYQHFRENLSLSSLLPNNIPDFKEVFYYFFEVIEIAKAEEISLYLAKQVFYALAFNLAILQAANLKKLKQIVFSKDISHDLNSFYTGFSEIYNRYAGKFDFWALDADLAEVFEEEIVSALASSFKDYNPKTEKKYYILKNDNYIPRKNAFIKPKSIKSKTLKKTNTPKDSDNIVLLSDGQALRIYLQSIVSQIKFEVFNKHTDMPYPPEERHFVLFRKYAKNYLEVDQNEQGDDRIYLFLTILKLAIHFCSDENLPAAYQYIKAGLGRALIADNSCFTESKDVINELKLRDFEGEINFKKKEKTSNLKKEIRFFFTKNKGSIRYLVNNLLDIFAKIGFFDKRKKYDCEKIAEAICGLFFASKHPEFFSEVDILDILQEIGYLYLDKGYIGREDSTFDVLRLEIKRLHNRFCENYNVKKLPGRFFSAFSDAIKTSFEICDLPYRNDCSFVLPASNLTLLDLAKDLEEILDESLASNDAIPSLPLFYYRLSAPKKTDYWKAAQKRPERFTSPNPSYNYIQYDFKKAFTKEQMFVRQKFIFFFIEYLDENLLKKEKIPEELISNENTIDVLFPSNQMQQYLVKADLHYLHRVNRLETRKPTITIRENFPLNNKIKKELAGFNIQHRDYTLELRTLNIYKGEERKKVAQLRLEKIESFKFENSDSHHFENFSLPDKLRQINKTLSGKEDENDYFLEGSAVYYRDELLGYFEIGSADYQHLKSQIEVQEDNPEIFLPFLREINFFDGIECSTNAGIEVEDLLAHLESKRDEMISNRGLDILLEEEAFTNKLERNYILNKIGGDDIEGLNYDASELISKYTQYIRETLNYGIEFYNHKIISHNLDELLEYFEEKRKEALQTATLEISNKPPTEFKSDDHFELCIEKSEDAALHLMLNCVDSKKMPEALRWANEILTQLELEFPHDQKETPAQLISDYEEYLQEENQSKGCIIS